MFSGKAESSRFRFAGVGSREPIPPLQFTPVAEEIFDVVDDQDEVVRQAPRSVVHANHWLHRAVHVFVFNPQGELLLQMRSPWKDEYPSTYTSSASGHLGTGESYEFAAPRELEEELGLLIPQDASLLEWVHKFPAGPETSFEHTVLYRTVCNFRAEEMRIDPKEVTAVTFHPLEEISAMLDRQPELFSPCLATLLRWYVQRQ